jgi:hypothetical protein
VNIYIFISGWDHPHGQDVLHEEHNETCCDLPNTFLLDESGFKSHSYTPQTELSRGEGFIEKKNPLKDGSKPMVLSLFEGSLLTTLVD